MSQKINSLGSDQYLDLFELFQENFNANKRIEKIGKYFSENSNLLDDRGIEYLLQSQDQKTGKGLESEVKLYIIEHKMLAAHLTAEDIKGLLVCSGLDFTLKNKLIQNEAIFNKLSQQSTGDDIKSLLECGNVNDELKNKLIQNEAIFNKLSQQSTGDDIKSLLECGNVNDELKNKLIQNKVILGKLFGSHIKSLLECDAQLVSKNFKKDLLEKEGVLEKVSGVLSSWDVQFLLKSGDLLAESKNQLIQNKVILGKLSGDDIKFLLEYIGEFVHDGFGKSLIEKEGILEKLSPNNINDIVLLINSFKSFPKDEKEALIKNKHVLKNLSAESILPLLDPNSERYVGEDLGEVLRGNEFVIKELVDEVLQGMREFLPGDECEEQTEEQDEEQQLEARLKHMSLAKRYTVSFAICLYEYLLDAAKGEYQNKEEYKSAIEGVIGTAMKEGFKVFPYGLDDSFEEKTIKLSGVSNNDFASRVALFCGRILYILGSALSLGALLRYDRKTESEPSLREMLFPNKEERQKQEFKNSCGEFVKNIQNVIKEKPMEKFDDDYEEEPEKGENISHGCSS